MYAYTAATATHAPVATVVKYSPLSLSNFAKEFGKSKRGEIKQLPQLHQQPEA